MNAPVDSKHICDTLSPFVTSERKARIEDVLDSRTEHVQVVLEDVSDLGNIQAVMRTTESLGFLDLHLINSRKEDRIKTSNRASSGSEKWLQIRHWDDAAGCVAHLKSRGFKIAVTDLRATETIDSLPVEQPLALVFGNEHAGTSPALMALADVRFRIPMRGFTQSFNISVAAAISLFSLSKRSPALPKLAEADRMDVRAHYYRQSVPYSDALLRHTRRNT